ncbi:5-oxoprolinase subunit C family protein [Gordonia sp. NPDC003950]
MSTLEVISPGPLATVQDLGRSGYAHLGVPVSGAADRVSLRLANRLVGNHESAAVIETTLGGLRIRADRETIIAVTGAASRVMIDDSPIGLGVMATVKPGAVLSISTPTWGCRNYLAVRGGIDVPAVLGSRSTDTLSGLGPPAIVAGDTLTVGNAASAWPAATFAPVRTDHHHQVVELDAVTGPRHAHVVSHEILFTGVWEASAEADRVGVRLVRPEPSAAPLLEHRTELPELLSEGVAHGSIQIPPGGRPVIFLADHPVTGGYPVVAVLTAAALSQAAQLVAGDLLRFRAR